MPVQLRYNHPSQQRMKASQNRNVLPNSVEIVKGRLYWICGAIQPNGVRFFCVDDKIKYLKYHYDFGPACMANVTNFSRLLHKFITDQQSNKSYYPLYFYSSNEPEKKANAAFLISAFQIVALKLSPEEVWNKLIDQDILPFRDASYNIDCQYQCTILDCLKAIEKAIKLNWYRLESFNIQEYEIIEQSNNGNINEIIPGEIIAFRGPLSQEFLEQQNKKGKYYRIAVKQLIPQLKKIKTAVVVRLNSPEEYDKCEITDSGIEHYDLYFPDGSCPKQEIIDQFCKIVEDNKARGCVGVHCKAGLGRTGTLIACYLMKKYHFSFRESIAWIRLCRSGSILGKQQYFLEEYEQQLGSQKASEENNNNKPGEKIFTKEVNKPQVKVTQPVKQGSVLVEITNQNKVSEKYEHSEKVQRSQNQIHPSTQVKSKLNIWSCFSVFKKKRDYPSDQNSFSQQSSLSQSNSVVTKDISKQNNQENRIQQGKLFCNNSSSSNTYYKEEINQAEKMLN